jgi:Na+-transporting methylmalonyl-CoA/oxaloacetate decarboxylase gamma subunit
MGERTMKAAAKWPLALGDNNKVAGLRSLPFSIRANDGVLDLAGMSSFDVRGMAPPPPRAEDRGHHQLERSLQAFAVCSMLSNCALLCVVCFLIVAACGMSAIINSNVDYYYSLAKPVIFELANHTVEIMRNADSSVAAVDRMALHTERASVASLESLVDSVNRTAAAVAAATEIVKHPVMRIGLEAAS